jgi:hypothetical protein
MAKIVLISCASKKLNHKAKAEDLYISPLFKKEFEYALLLKPDKIFILSAKYGLLDINEEIEPYDKTLNKMTSKEIKAWANSVLNQLEQIANLKENEFIFLAGNKYRKFLLPHIKYYRIPMEHIDLFHQQPWLTIEISKLRQKMSKNCQILHQWFHSMPKFRFPFDEKDIPLNGIYILFEKGEFAHSTNRIVRIGTNTGNNQLRSRLQQHFIKENKDRSIFRKNIGRALLNRDKDTFLKKWELDLTPKKSRNAHSSRIDFDKQKEIEKRVTKYMQENFSFVVFEINDKEKRLEIESKIISTVSSCEECKPSKNWLGLFSPKEKIRKSGLWLVNELWKTPLSDEDMIELKETLQIK